MIHFDTILGIATDDRRCARCDEPLVGELFASSTWNSAVSLHLDCAVDVDAKAASTAIRLWNKPFAARDALLALADARMRAERDANVARKPSSPVAIEPARDRRGRPRVRVLFVQSERGALGPTDEFFAVQHLCKHSQLCSSLREYALVEHLYPKNARIDPSQPTVACMYWQRADAAVATNNGRLVEWKALGLAAPVLVLAGHAADATAQRDKLVAKLRALVARAGFDPDDAPVVFAARVEAAAIERIALALDEQAPKVAAVVEKRKSARFFESLDELFADERDDALAAAFNSAFKRFTRSRADERARVIALLVKFAERSPEEAAKTIVGVERHRIEIDDESFHSITRAMLAVDKRVPAQLARWIEHRARMGNARSKTLEAQFREAICNANARKKKALEAVAAQCDVRLS
ncbi:MAG: hypothetical protein U0269_22995 [Polyangiales bacterium]